MANRVFIVPRRPDLAGMNLNVGDLKPNAGQKNGVYDGEPQNVYLAEGLDQLGSTTVSGLAYVSGSRNTSLAANAVADDTTGGGDDVTAMQATTFGLAAYLKDRVQAGGVVDDTSGEMAFADCNAVAQDIMDRVHNGQSLTLAAINTLLDAQVADTDLDGSTGDSKSFGSVEDILRIFAGEVYRLPALTIIEDVGGTFQDLAERQAIVDAQTGAIIATQGQFFASGSFLTASDAGFRRRPVLLRTTAFNASNAGGVLAGAKGNLTFLNPNFAYTAATVKTWRPRALLLDTSELAATGTQAGVVVYDRNGNVL